MLAMIRARQGVSVAIATAAAVLLVLASGRAGVGAPFLHDPVEIRLRLVAPVLLAVALVPALPAPVAELERAMRARAQVSRGVVVLWASCSVVVAGLAVAAQHSETVAGLEIVRNGALLVGLLLGAAWIGAVPWVVPVVVVAATYTVGLDPITLEERRWALLLAPVSAGNMLVGLTVLTCGAALYVVRPSLRRAGRGRGSQ